MKHFQGVAGGLCLLLEDISVGIFVVALTTEKLLDLLTNNYCLLAVGLCCCKCLYIPRDGS